MKNCQKQEFNSFAQGFTLLELLVTISIIGILSTLTFANLNSARQRARDAQRKADLRNIQTALRLYYNDKSLFPANDSSGQIVGCGAAAATACTWGGEWKAGNNIYMPKLSLDPLDGQAYKYQRSDEDNYSLTACLENKSDDKGQATADTVWCSSGWMYEVKP